MVMCLRAGDTSGSRQRFAEIEGLGEVVLEAGTRCPDIEVVVTTRCSAGKCSKASANAGSLRHTEDRIGLIIVTQLSDATEEGFMELRRPVVLVGGVDLPARGQVAAVAKSLTEAWRQVGLPP